MKKIKFSPQKTMNHIATALILLLMTLNCTSQKQLTGASQFRFTYNDEVYRIRSVSAIDNGNSYNQLISTKYVATDYDKDRVLDKVTMGEVDLASAQKVYEYGLNILTVEDKVQIYRVNTIDYMKVNSDYDYQIKSFYPQGSEPFNEFKIIRKHELWDREIIIVDKKADGTLDEVLKGPIEEVKDYQERYIYVINSGLERHKLVKKDDMILVKAK